MEQQIPKFEYVLITITDPKIKFKVKLKELQYLYGDNIYFLGPDKAHEWFCKNIGNIKSVIGDVEQLINQCQYYHIDQANLFSIEEYKYDKKIIIYP